MRFQGTLDLSRRKSHERHDRTFVARRTHRNRQQPSRTHEHKNHPNLRQNHRPKDKPRHGNLVAQVGGHGEEYLPSHLIKSRIPMKEERNIITMDERGNISLPSDIGATAMTEWEICELFGVIAPTVRAGIKALCKSGVLSIYDIKRIIRISDRYSAEVYNLETIAALAFRIESFGAAKVRKVLLERIIHGRKENTTMFVSVCRTASTTVVESVMMYRRRNMESYQQSTAKCKPILCAIYAESISPITAKRSNHSRLQRQSKHGALRRLKGRAAAPFPDKSSSRFAASVFIGKTLYPTAPCKRAFENENDRPATHRPKGKK